MTNKKQCIFTRKVTRENYLKTCAILGAAAILLALIVCIIIGEVLQ